MPSDTRFVALSCLVALVACAPSNGEGTGAAEEGLRGHRKVTDTQAPTAPTSLSASNVTSAGITLSWQASTDNVGVTGYEVWRNGAVIATVAGTSHTDSGLQPSTAYRYSVRAKDAAGNFSAMSSPATATTLASTAGGSTPDLQAIDGEHMIDSLNMSHNYYSSGGFTYATNNPAYPGISWDSPSFFPLETFYGLYVAQQSDMTTFNDLGMNVSTCITGNSTYDLLGPNGTYALPCWNGSTIENPVGSWAPGLHIDEVTPDPVLAAVPNATQDGRYWDLTATWNTFIFGDINQVPMSQVLNKSYPTPNGTTRKIDTYSSDVYWFAGSINPPIQDQGGAILHGWDTVSATPDEMARGSNYGNMIDVYRSWGNSTNTAGPMAGTYTQNGAPSRIPFAALVENGDGLFSESTKRSITPPEMQWAVWSSIIHGARAIDYFTDYRAFVTTIQPGQNISLYDQAKATNALINQLAPVINSPFAINYVIASPHGYNFPKPESNWLNGGIETMAKYYNGTYYIFADTRDSETMISIPATFTVANTGATNVTVVGENRTIPLTNGTTFSDTFAHAWTVHIYQVR